MRGSLQTSSHRTPQLCRAYHWPPLPRVMCTGALELPSALSGMQVFWYTGQVRSYLHQPGSLTACSPLHSLCWQHAKHRRDTETGTAKRSAIIGSMSGRLASWYLQVSRGEGAHQ